MDSWHTSAKRMAHILIIFVFYCICESAFLVWSTLLDKGHMLRPQASWCGIEYVAIPKQVLFEWNEQSSNLVIFDLHPDRAGSKSSEFSCWLRISPADLANVLKWLPPTSRVVFCCRDATEHLNTRTKTILLQLGIETVYFLEESLVVRPNSRSAPEVTRRAGNRQVPRITTRGASHCL